MTDKEYDLLWADTICKGTNLDWVAVKMIEKLYEHQRKYPGFDAERVARWFAMYKFDEKSQKRMCYESASSLNASAKMTTQSRGSIEAEEYLASQRIFRKEVIEDTTEIQKRYSAKNLRSLLEAIKSPNNFQNGQ